MSLSHLKSSQMFVLALNILLKLNKELTSVLKQMLFLHLHQNSMLFSDFKINIFQMFQ